MIDKNNIPKHWEVKNLGEVCEKISNGSSAKQFFEKVGLPISRIETIWNETIDESRVKYIKETDFCFSEKYKLKKYDILFSHINSDIHLGKTAIYKSSPKVLIHGINLLLIRSNKLIESNFLNFQLKLLRAKGKFIQIAQKSVNQSSINQFKLKKIEIILPSLHEQHQIVSKIEELFDEIENGKQKLLAAKQELENYKQSLLKAAFEGRLTNKNVKDGELPKGWKILELDSVIEEIEAGKSFKCDERPPKDYEVGVLKLSAVTWQFYDENESKTVLDDKKINKNYFVKAGDFLMSRANTLELIGSVVLVENVEKKLMLSDKTLRLVFNDSINKKFILFYLRSKIGRSEIENLSSGNQVSMRNIGQAKIRQIKFPFCSIENQNRVVIELETKLNECKNIKNIITQNLQQAETLKQSILQQAFEGKLVKNIVQTKVVEMYKPKNEYFYQCQILATVIRASNKKNIQHGEMTLAKTAYLIDKIFDIPTYYDYKQWHLGPYAPAMKKAINKKDFFNIQNNNISLAEGNKLFQYDNPNIALTENAIDELSDILLKYNSKDRPHKIELLATVCKVVEDIKTTTLVLVREAMINWKIDLKNKAFRNKAEKFSELETERCLQLIVGKGWDKKLIK